MSSVRGFLQAYLLIKNQSMDSNITSTSTFIGNKDQICITISSVNTNAVGQWYIDASPDNVIFVPMTFQTPINSTLSGVNDLILLDMKLLSFPYIRVRWVGSGTGIANVLITAKGN